MKSMHSNDREKLQKQRVETIKELQQLKNRQKMLQDHQNREERKARARRLIERGAILESVFPTLKEWDNQKIRVLLQKLSYLPEANKMLNRLAEDDSSGEDRLFQGRTYTP